MNKNKTKFISLFLITWHETADYKANNLSGILLCLLALSTGVCCWRYFIGSTNPKRIILFDFAKENSLTVIQMLAQ